MATRYRVKQGDSLREIAERYNTTTSAILRANSGVSSVGPGVVLNVPTTPVVTYTGAGRASAPIDPKGPPTPDLPGTPGYTPPTLPTYPPFIPKPRPTQPSPTPDPKSPWTPDLPQPAPIQPRPQPRPTQPQTPIYQPPSPTPRQITPQYFVPQATREEARQARPARIPFTGQGAGLIPGTFGAQPAEQFVQQIAPGIQGLLNRLFRQRPLNNFRRPGEPTAGARFAPSFTQQETGAALGRVADYISRPLPEGIEQAFRRLPGAGLSNIPGAAIRTLARNVSATAPYQGSLASLTGAGGGLRGLGELSGDQVVAAGEGGPIWYRMSMADGSDRLYGYSTDETKTAKDYEVQRASHVGQSLRGGQRPQIILESDRENLGLSAEDMQTMGYYWDEEKGHWVAGLVVEESPQTYGAAAPYGGYGYPSRRRGRGGGGGYSYPRGGSYSYPQSLVGREQRGIRPEADRNRPARFGAVTWRI